MADRMDFDSTSEKSRELAEVFAFWKLVFTDRDLEGHTRESTLMLKLSDDLTEAQRIDTLYEKLTEYHSQRLRTHESIEEGLAAVDATSSRLRTEIGRLKMIAVMEREMRESLSLYKIDFDRKDIRQDRVARRAS